MWPKVTDGKLSFLPIPIGTSPLLLLADVGWVPTSARCGSSSESLDSDRIQKYAMLRPQAATAIQMVIEARPAFLAAAGMAAPAGRLSTARRAHNSYTATLMRPAPTRTNFNRNTGLRARWPASAANRTKPCQRHSRQSCDGETARAPKRRRRFDRGEASKQTDIHYRKRTGKEHQEYDVSHIGSRIEPG